MHLHGAHRAHRKGLNPARKQDTVGSQDRRPNTFLPGGHIDYGEYSDVALIRELREELGIETKVERLTSLGGKGILTDRQEKIIRVAYELGYFDFPRKIDSTGLANKLDISVSTLSEILRAAERRIFSEYLRV